MADAQPSDPPDDECRSLTPLDQQRTRQRNISNAALASSTESILFFVSAAGCTLGSTAVLSLLVYYTDTLGMDSFLSLNLAIYIPLLPITLAQAVYDARFDRDFQSLRSFAFRGVIGYSVSLVCILLLPYTSQSLTLVSITSLFLGLASAVLHGMLKQMASFVYPDCGRLPAAVTAGMQASSLMILGVALITGDASRQADLKKIYFIVAALLVVCWACFQLLLYYSEGVVRSMTLRDSLFRSEHGQWDPLEDRESGSLPETVDEEFFEDEELSLGVLWRRTSTLCWLIIVTVASSMSVGAWYNRVESQDPSYNALPQVLFYTRLIADLLARPATLCMKIRSTSFITMLSLLRLSFVPVFFLYASSDLIPKNDAAIVVGVFAFAFSSGYVVTACYQLCRRELSEDERCRNLGKQTSLVNVCFSGSVLLGLIFSLVLKSAIA